MKTSIRSRRFIVGMVLFLVIILLLSVSSAFYLNKLSGKTSAILKENHYSVVYARDMSERLIAINQEITSSFIKGENPDGSLINNAFNLFDKSLALEKSNITEVGEDALALNIEKSYLAYKDSVKRFITSQRSNVGVIHLQKMFEDVNHLLMQLSQMNENVIEIKTEDAKLSAKSSALQMTFIGTICFLIAYGFTFSFSSYFNERFYKLYNGIKEIASSNYRNRLSIIGSDELAEISTIVNDMAERINSSDSEVVAVLKDPVAKENSLNELEELKGIISKMKVFEEQASDLILRIENKMH